MVNYFQILLNNINVFNPGNQFIIYWDIINFITILIAFIVTPIHASFVDIDIQPILFYSKILWILDFIISQNRGFYKEGLIVEDRKKILKKYFKSKFLYDLIAFAALFAADSFVLNLVFAKLK